MRARIGFWIWLVLPFVAKAQEPVTYRLAYRAPGDCCVHVEIVFPEPMNAPMTMVMPRTYPGGYEQIPYDSYVEAVSASSPSGKGIAVKRAPDGPRWNVGKTGDEVQRLDYQIDVARMEGQIISSVETSKVRRGYAGLLGYSVFAYVDGLEDHKIQLQVNAPEGWPVLTTLAPQVPAPTTTTAAEASDYYALADSEVLLGPDIQFRRFDGPIPLVLAVYAECDEDVAAEAQLARKALDRVQSYFADTPLRQYTVQLELVRPIAKHEYDFSQEHIDSGTFSFSVERALTAQSSTQQRETVLFNYAHHMAHSWIPKRAYGAGYRPFTWELAPVIDTIWFNEGFGRYAAIQAIADELPPAQAAAFRESQLSRLRGILDGAPLFIRKMPLEVLSREASFLYAVDFRTGKNVFARGALMAAEMDDRFREKTAGKKSLRDALQALLAWSQTNQRPFRMEEMMQIFSAATGVNVNDILQRWMEPLSK